MKSYYLRNREKIREYKRNYYQKNKKQMKQNAKEWHSKNRDRSLELHRKASKKSSKKYYTRNRKKCLKRSREYRKNHKDKVKKSKDNWYKNNQEHIKSYRRQFITTTIDGKQVKIKVKKRPRPKDNRCEICNDQAKRLVYHHIGKIIPNEFLDGIWMCSRCHLIVGIIERIGVDELIKRIKKYVELRKQLQIIE